MDLRDMVEKVLQDVPETRNSDITLMIEVWKRFYSHKLQGMAVALQDLYELPREDNIKRLRAKFNEYGKYLPTSWEVAQQRRIDEGVWREYMRKFPVNGVQVTGVTPPSGVSKSIIIKSSSRK